MGEGGGGVSTSKGVACDYYFFYLFIFFACLQSFGKIPYPRDWKILKF